MICALAEKKYICSVMFDVTLISDTMEGGIRKAAFLTCDAVCSQQPCG